MDDTPVGRTAGLTNYGFVDQTDTAGYKYTPAVHPNMTTWYPFERLLPTIPNGFMQIQRDTPGKRGASKQFCVSSWEHVYECVKRAYDAHRPLSWYEQRNPDLPCNLHVDIDDEVASEAEFDEGSYLSKVRHDLNTHGITEDWYAVRSSGSKNGKYKVSYHITIPYVRFASHKHLKSWFKTRCTKIIEDSGFKKNGHKKTKTIYLLGSTKIDMSVYCKGAWRFPMCVKDGSKRVLEYEPMSFEIFKQLSIHYIADCARYIDVELNQTKIESNKKSSHVISRTVSVCPTQTRLTEGEKRKYQLVGDFVWGDDKDDGRNIKSLCTPWTCPLGEVHEHNRQTKVKINSIYCYGCDKEHILRHSIDPNANAEWCGNTLRLIIDVCRKRPNMTSSEERERAGDGFFHHEFARFSIKNMIGFMKRFTFTATVADGYRLKRGDRMLRFTKANIFEADKRITLPSRLRDRLFGFQYITLDDALSRHLIDHEDPIVRPVVEGRVFTCGKHCPAYNFADTNGVLDARRERCPYEIVTDCHDLMASLPMGSGKTFALRDNIRRRRYNPALVVTPRRVLGRTMVKDLNEKSLRKFEYYLDERNNINKAAKKANRLVCSVDSLAAFVNPYHKEFKEFDVVVLDEAVTILNHFGASFLREGRKAMNLLKRIISKAKHTIVLDADLKKSNQVESFLTKCGRTSVAKLISTAKTDNNLYLQISADDDFYLRVKELVGRGLKVGIVSNYKKEVQKIHALLTADFPDKRGVAIYNDENHQFHSYLFPGEAKPRQFDVRHDTLNLNWFAFSPSISPGTSITDEFDVLCAHALASDLTAPLLYWNQLLNRVRTLRKRLVLFKIESCGAPRLSLRLKDIKRDYLNGISLSKPDLNVTYGDDGAELESNLYTSNCLFIEQNLRYCGYFEEYFKKWRLEMGATFDFLRVNEPIDVCKESKKRGKELANDLRTSIIEKIASAPILDHSAHGEPNSDSTYAARLSAYCEQNGIDHHGDRKLIKTHMLKYYQRDERPRRFCHMLFDTEDRCDNMFNSFDAKRAVFKRILNILGFTSFADTTVFAEKDGATIDTAKVDRLMSDLSKNERIAHEFSFRKAKGDAYTWIKYAFNLLGSQLGLTDRKIRLMVGKPCYRRWSIRGLLENGEICDRLFRENLEFAHMRYGHKRRIALATMKAAQETFRLWKEGRVSLQYFDYEWGYEDVEDVPSKHRENLRKYERFDRDDELFKSKTEVYASIRVDLSLPCHPEFWDDAISVTVINQSGGHRDKRQKI